MENRGSQLNAELKDIGHLVACFAVALIPQIISDDNIPSVTTRAQAVDAVEQVVTQSPPETSRRAWSVFFAAMTAVLAVPEVQELIGSWYPVATALLSAALAFWSKSSDPRPMR
jgi:hypothetical protein